MKTVVVPYIQGSKSARALASGIGVKVMKTTQSKFTGKSKDLVINWGSTNEYGNIHQCLTLNPATAVRIAVNKLSSYTTFAACGVRCPPFTVDIEEAKTWIAEGSSVLCRLILCGRGGAGIVVAEAVEDLVAAKVYTKYIKKKEEFRVHVVNAKVIDVQRKMRSKSVPDDEVDWKIRNHKTGFIFGRNEISVPQDVLDQGLLAVLSLGLSFGAVDVAYNEHEGKAYVLEVNTAPGLEGTTLTNYVTAFKEIMNANV